MTPEELTKAIENLQNTLIKRIEKGLSSGYFSDVELAQLVSEIDFFEELKSLGYDNLLDKYFEEYEKIVLNLREQAKNRGVENISGASLRDLDSLIDVRAEELLGRARQYGLKLRTVLFENIIAGTPTKELIDKLQETKLADYQLTASINTGITEFERSAVAKIYEGEPETKFLLIGVDDNRNRPSCESVLKYQPKEGWTKKEIDNGAATKLVKEHAKEFARSRSELEQALKNPYTFQSCGGINCRHRWKVVE